MGGGDGVERLGEGAVVLLLYQGPSICFLGVVTVARQGAERYVD